MSMLPFVLISMRGLLAVSLRLIAPRFLRLPAPAAPAAAAHLCRVCGHRRARNALLRHFDGIHAREHAKRLARIDSARGGRRARLAAALSLKHAGQWRIQPSTRLRRADGGRRRRGASLLLLVFSGERRPARRFAAHPLQRGGRGGRSGAAAGGAGAGGRSRGAERQSLVVAGQASSRGAGQRHWGSEQLRHRAELQSES